ncbi:MAG TPA: RES superfamily protein [Flavobacteriaceae bacterium]|jgi:RES domain-containing protein|nr:RES superfamily protein [Flavobacteriaceae bacterium]HBS11926.1 RES superfamily protein [Flavobacteriaceae bacterium]
MQVYRISRKKYANELSGIGASKSGNRWNSKGTKIIYCADSRALAMAEVSVHLSLATLPKDFVMLEINIPKTIAVQVLSKNELSEDWSVFPHTYKTQQIGDEFIYSKKIGVLKVPSAVVKGDFNYLINPHHKDFKKIKIVDFYDFPFDNRLFL